MLDVCSVPTSYDEYIATVKTGNDCQLSAYILLLGKFATMVCCAKVLFQPSFLHVVSTLHAEWSTDRTTKPDTAQTQTERVLTRLVDTASLDSRLHQVCISQATRVFLHNIHVLTLFHPVLSLPVLHAQLFVVPRFTLRAWWRSCWLFYVDPRQYIMTTTDVLLAKLVNLENEAVQARQRQSTAEPALTPAQQRIQQ